MGKRKRRFGNLSKRVIRGLSIFMTAIFLAASAFVFSPSVYAQGNNSDFTIDSNGVLIAYNGSGGNVVIPDGVTEIRKEAFCNCRTITSVTIPESVTAVGDYAFSNCSNLKDITFPSGLTQFGVSSFFDTLWEDNQAGDFVVVNGTLIDYRGAGGDIVIPSTVKNIGPFVFRFKGITGVTIPYSVTTIGYDSFSDNNGLKEITIPSSVTAIEDNAFSHCEQLTKVTLPEGLKSIGFDAFDWCLSLTDVTVPNSVVYIGEDAFDSTPWLDNQYGTDGFVTVGNGILLKYKGDGGAVTVPDSIINIAGGAFSGDNLGSEGFAETFTKVTEITISKNVTYIGEYAFDGCLGLTGITVDSANPAYMSQNGVLFSKDQTVLLQYPGGNTLTSYTIPDGVTGIAKGAFEGSKFADISMPDSVKSVGDNAFYSSKIQRITLSKSTKFIGTDAFRSCAQLTDIQLPAGLVTIGYGAFSDSGLTGIAIPDSVTNIEDYTFVNCKSLASVTLPKNITVLPYAMFSGCTALTNFTVPDTVIHIRDWVFSGCTNLKNVVIPDSVTDFGSYIFEEAGVESGETVSDYFPIDVTIQCNSDSAAVNFAKNAHIKCILLNSTSSGTSSTSSGAGGSTTGGSSSGGSSTGGSSTGSSSTGGSATGGSTQNNTSVVTVGSSSATSATITSESVKTLASTDNIGVRLAGVSVDIPAGNLNHLLQANGLTGSVTISSSPSGAFTLSNGTTAIASITLTLTDENGKPLTIDDFGGNVQVTWTIPATQASKIDTSTAKLYHVADDGTITAVPATFTSNSDGSILVVFQTTHFSSYAVANGNIANNPKTGDDSFPLPNAIVLMVLIASAIAVLSLHRKKATGEN